MNEREGPPGQAAGTPSGASDNDSKAGFGVKAARGVFWIGGGGLVRQIVSIVTAVVLARLLAPEDFGLIAMAHIFIAFAQLFADFGIGAAIMRSRDTDPSILSSAFWTSIGVAAALAVIMVVGAPAIAAFYDDPRLFEMTIALSLTLLLAGAVSVPRALLYRDMRFDRATQAPIAGSLAGSLVAVTLAWNNFGVWSLVWQPICGSGVSFVLMFAFARWRPRLTFSWRRIRHLVSFSVDVLGADVLDYVKQNGDKLIVGKLLGSTPLGYYSLGFQLMLYPITYVAAVIARVLFPTLSIFQNERIRMQKTCLKAMAAVSLVTFPMMVGLFLVADDFILVVFGEKWSPMRPVLQILCVVGMLQSVGATANTIFLSTGQTRILFRLALVSAAVTLAAVAIGAPWGINGVAAAYATASVFFVYLELYFAMKLIGLRLRDLHSTLRGSIAATITMAAVVWLTSTTVGDVFGGGPIMRLGLCIAAGVLAYGLGALLFNRNQILELWRLASASIRRSGGAEVRCDD